MTTKLALFNDALVLRLGERAITALTDETEGRRKLDTAYTNGVDDCLSKADWNFAIRTSKIEYSSSVTPEFGYARAFEKPSDWVKTAAISVDEYFSVPLLQYEDEQSYWFCDHDEIYVRYVSNDSSYGGDLSLWPASFTSYVASYLAYKIAPGLSKSDSLTDRIEKQMMRDLVNAQSIDARNEPTRFAPPGSWSSARHRGVTSRHDRGSRSSLIG